MVWNFLTKFFCQFPDSFINMLYSRCKKTPNSAVFEVGIKKTTTANSYVNNRIVMLPSSHHFLKISDDQAFRNFLFTRFFESKFYVELTGREIFPASTHNKLCDI